jgi:TRAP-type C4-dicarboxylate transport system substrate-binding protein
MLRKLWALFISVGLVLLMVFVVVGCAKTTPAPAQVIKLVFSEFEPAGSYWETEIARPYFAELEKRTNGKVKVEQHYGGELVGLFDVYDAVLKGSVDIAKILPTMFADKFPIDGIGIFPPVNVKTYRPGKAFIDLYNKFPQMQAQYKTTPLLGYAFMPCSGLATTSKVKIMKWEDCKGLKAPGAGPAPESRQKAVGMVPVSMAPPDVYMGFKTGTLDVIASALMSLKDFGWNDVMPNVTMVNINGSPWSYVISQQAWNKLPADVQKVMVDMIPWLTELNDKVQYQNEQKALNTFVKEYGTNFIRLSQAELDRWAAVDGPTLDAYVAQFITAKGMPGNDIKNEYLTLIKKYAESQYAFK